jgi:hypothetical protein
MEFSFLYIIYIQMLDRLQCIGALQGLGIWIILALAAYILVPDEYTFVRDNASWALGVAVLAWWLSGYAREC